MRKILAFSLVMILSVAMVACTGNDNNSITSSQQESSSEQQVVSNTSYKTGVASVTKVSVTPEDETAKTGAKVKLNTTIVAASFDKDGKVISAEIDVTDNVANFDMDGKLVEKIDTRTKNEKGDDYGLKAASSIEKEIDDQHSALEEWFVGKSVEEITKMSQEEDQDLKAGVTINVSDYVQALAKAYDNAVETEQKADETKLGVVVNANVEDENAKEEKGAKVTFTTTYIVVALGEDGTIIASQTDVAKNEIAFDLEGKSAAEVETRTKNEQGDDYGMKAVSSIKKEINEQHDSLTQWMTGKKLEDVLSIKTVSDDADLNAGVTIDITSYMEALNKAVE